MMPQDMPQHDDEKQDVDMISHILRKIADEMDQMDADGYLPDHMKPKQANITVEAHSADEPQDSDGEESDDTSLLPSLMDKSKEADDEGNLPEDKSEEVDPSIAAIVSAKKQEQGMNMGGEMGYAEGGKTPHFLEGLKKGALHEDLGVPQDTPIPSGKLEKATHSDNETLRKRAQFAENAKHFHH